MDRRPELTDPLAHHMTLRRLKAAGLIARFDISAEGRAWIEWTDDYLALLEAGRNPMAEAGLQAAWATGDARQVKAWVKREARKLAKTRRR